MCRLLQWGSASMSFPRRSTQDQLLSPRTTALMPRGAKPTRPSHVAARGLFPRGERSLRRAGGRGLVCVRTIQAETHSCAQRRCPNAWRAGLGDAPNSPLWRLASWVGGWVARYHSQRAPPTFLGLVVCGRGRRLPIPASTPGIAGGRQPLPLGVALCARGVAANGGVRKLFAAPAN